MSTIFETPEECKQHPFIFEKGDLKQNSPADYENIKRKGNMQRLVQKNK
jgi:hypothetical protein